MRVACRIQQHRLCANGLRLVQPINQMTFMVRLPKINHCPCGTRTVVQMAGNIIQRIGAVDFGLSCAQQIEIWSI